MSFGFFSEDIYPGSYLGSFSSPLGYSVGCGYGRTDSPVGYGFGYGYGGFRPLDYRRYWTFDLY
uniref:Keratin associated protein 8-1 n=1 Tax=Equus asinus TaxID=9793 RepID=A0A8C4LH44_EQUAS